MAYGLKDREFFMAVASRHFSFEDRQRIESVVAANLLEGGELAFFARDLGWDDHSAIHKAMKPVLARHVARILTRYLSEEDLSLYLSQYEERCVNIVPKA